MQKSEIFSCWRNIGNKRTRMAKPSPWLLSHEGHVLCTAMGCTAFVSFKKWRILQQHGRSWQLLAVPRLGSSPAFDERPNSFEGATSQWPGIAGVWSLAFSAQCVIPPPANLCSGAHIGLAKDLSGLYCGQGAPCPTLLQVLPSQPLVLLLCLIHCSLGDATGKLPLPLPASGKLPLFRQNSQTLPKSPSNRLGYKYVYETIETSQSNSRNVCQDIKWNGNLQCVSQIILNLTSILLIDLATFMTLGHTLRMLPDPRALFYYGFSFQIIWHLYIWD